MSIWSGCAGGIITSRRNIGETDRCLIRELSLSDLPALYELYDKPGMTDFVEPLYDYETELEYQKAYIENMYGLLRVWHVACIFQGNRGTDRTGRA